MHIWIFLSLLVFRTSRRFGDSETGCWIRLGREVKEMGMSLYKKIVRGPFLFFWFLMIVQATSGWWLFGDGDVTTEKPEGPGGYEDNCVEDDDCKHEFYCDLKRNVCACRNNILPRLIMFYDKKTGNCLSTVGKMCVMPKLTDGLWMINCVPNAACQPRDNLANIFGICECNLDFEETPEHLCKRKGPKVKVLQFDESTSTKPMPSLVKTTSVPLPIHRSPPPPAVLDLGAFSPASLSQNTSQPPSFPRNDSPPLLAEEVQATATINSDSFEKNEEKEIPKVTTGASNGYADEKEGTFTLDNLPPNTTTTEEDPNAGIHIRQDILDSWDATSASERGFLISWVLMGATFLVLIMVF